MSSSEEEELVGDGSNDEDLKILETPHNTTGWKGENSDAEVIEDKKEVSKVSSRGVRTIPDIIHEDLTFEERQV